MVRIRRLFSTNLANNVYKNCVDCRLYNNKTKLCKINKINATDNRMNDNICGIDGKKFWALDKTYLIKSIEAKNASDNFALFALVTLPCGILSISFMSFIFSCVSSDNSNEYEKKYLDDNDINI